MICWWRPSRAPEPRNGRSICRPASGTISGRTNATKGPAESAPRRRLTGCRCSCGKARSSRWVRPCSTTTNARSTTSPSSSTAGRSHRSRCTKATAQRAYEQGRFALTDVECVSNSAGLTVRIAAPKGEASLIPAGRAYTLRVHAPKPPRVVSLDGHRDVARQHPGAAEGWWHDGGHFVFIRVPRTPASVTIGW